MKLLQFAIVELILFPTTLTLEFRYVLDHRGDGQEALYTPLRRPSA